MVASPYCNALAQHFNSVLAPMTANDRVFGVVNVQLDDMNEMFTHLDYVSRFLDLRTKLLKETDVLTKSLPPMKQQIDQLRDSASLTTDPQAAKEMRNSAAALQDAYLHQMQLSTDLSNLARAMMQYDIFRARVPLGGWSPYDNTLPADAKDVKSYLRYASQLATISSGEDRAVDLAYTAATTYCSASAAPSASPR